MFVYTRLNSRTARTRASRTAQAPELSDAGKYVIDIVK